MHRLRSIALAAQPSLPYLRRLIGLALIVVLAWQLWYHGDLAAWWPTLLAAWQQPGAAGWLLAAVLLMPLNWALETIKWRGLLRVYWPAGWSTAFRAVMAGVGVSLATPNRIGEYGGRLLVVPAEQMGAVVWTTLVGSLCQWLVFLLLGWPALIGLLAEPLHMTWRLAVPLAVSLPLVALAIPLLWDFLMRGLETSRWGDRWPRWRWVRRQWLFRQRVRGEHLRKALWWATLRFLVYTLQYYLLLRFFGLPIGWWEGLAGISAIYLVQAGLPLPPGLGVFTRTELAIWLWGGTTVHPAGILAATVTLFLINLALPALLGAGLIVKTRESKTLKYANENS
ncbi:MAG: flippase-like domain-containing protein [Lewinella sp.]|nr:flippase-like domain-containing protein [Lewinella sp.]